MNKLITSIIIILFSVTHSYPQCFINIISDTVAVDTVEICLGDSIKLYAVSNCGNLLYDDFNTGTMGNGWSFNTPTMFNNPCPPLLPPASGIVCWVGSVVDFPRMIETIPLNVTIGVAYKIIFDMKYGDVQTSVNCEDPDLPDEGVHLQYSIDNGQTWNDIKYWVPDPNITGPLYTWTHYEEDVPLAAVTLNTQFRWFQSVTSGFEYDHWGIDNVEIKGSGSGSIIVNWSTGDTTFSPPTMHPVQTSKIFCSLTDTINGWFSIDSVLLIVNPLPISDLGNDTTVCVDDFLILHAGSPGSDYQWSNGNASEYIVVYSPIPDTTIHYSVIITDNNGCIGYDTINVTFIPCASIAEQLKSPLINIFPNPSTGKLNIKIPNIKEEVEIQILNIRGQLLRRENLKLTSLSHTKEFDLHMLPKGIYFINFRGESFVKTKRLVIR